MNRSGIKSLMFFSAFAMLASTLSMQAMQENIAAEEVMAVIPPGVQKEVAVEQGFSDLTQEALDLRFKNAQKELDRSWSSFIKCMTIGGKDCSAQARTVGVILKAILAAITAYALRGTVQKFRGAGSVTREQAKEESEEAEYGTLTEEEIELQEVDRPSTTGKVEIPSTTIESKLVEEKIEPIVP